MISQMRLSAAFCAAVSCNSKKKWYKRFRGLAFFLGVCLGHFTLLGDKILDALDKGHFGTPKAYPLLVACSVSRFRVRALVASSAS
jgi:hypothetical protein